MAKISSLLENNPLDAISNDGFFKAEDIVLGQRVQELDMRGIPLASQYGLRFCSTNVLNHSQIRPILDSAFDRSALGLYRTIGSAPEVFSFISAPQSKMEILIVMLWSSGSQFSFWPGSHRYWLNTVNAANSLLEVPRARLEELGLEAQEQTLERGGFTVHDARVAFHIQTGRAIVFAFAPRQVIQTWKPMELPRSLESIVVEIESTTIGVNATYREDVKGPLGGTREG